MAPWKDEMKHREREIERKGKEEGGVSEDGIRASSGKQDEMGGGQNDSEGKEWYGVWEETSKGKS